jgi:hypothetical protein
MLEDITGKIIERGAALWGKDIEELSGETQFSEVKATADHFAIIIGYLEEAYGKKASMKAFRESLTINEAARKIYDFLCEG